MRGVKLLSSQHGMTVVEMLVASAIGLILLAGAMQIFLANRQTYALQEASAYVQETGRFGMEFLTRDLRMAGFMGCKPRKITNNLDPSKGKAASHFALGNNGSLTFDGTGSFVGYRYNAADTDLPAALKSYGLTADLVMKGTDVMVVKRASACPGADIVCHNNQSSGSKPCSNGSVSSAQYKIADNSACQIEQDDILMISDCQNADIHAVTNTPNGTVFVNIAHGANGNLTPKLANSYGPGAAVYRMSATVFYIGFVNGDANSPALFRCTISGIEDTCATAAQREPLVDGIYAMTIDYGEDTDGTGSTGRLTPTQYRPAGSVTAWDSVAAARVTLSTRSARDNITREASNYTYNGSAVSDRRLRRNFSTTVSLRNRVN